MPSNNYLASLVVLVTLLANIGLAMAGITGTVACTVNQARAQAAAAAAALW